MPKKKPFAKASTTREATVAIHLLLKNEAGEPLGMLGAAVSRVPGIGEHVGWDADDWNDDNDVRGSVYRVTHVMHIPTGEAAVAGERRVLAEVWAVKDDSAWPGGAPKDRAGMLVPIKGGRR